MKRLRAIKYVKNQLGHRSKRYRWLCMRGLLRMYMVLADQRRKIISEKVAVSFYPIKIIIRKQEFKLPSKPVSLSKKNVAKKAREIRYWN